MLLFLIHKLLDTFFYIYVELLALFAWGQFVPTEHWSFRAPRGCWSWFQLTGGPEARHAIDRSPASHRTDAEADFYTDFDVSQYLSSRNFYVWGDWSVSSQREEEEAVAFSAVGVLADQFLKSSPDKMPARVVVNSKTIQFSQWHIFLPRAVSGAHDMNFKRMIPTKHGQES